MTPLDLLAPPADLAHALAVGPDGAVLHRSWWSWAGPHGGLLAGIALRAAEPVLERSLGVAAVRSLTAHFLRPAAEGPVVLAPRLLRAGRSSAVVTVEVDPGEAGPAVVATVTGGLAGDAGWADVPVPPAPDPLSCPHFPVPVEVVPFGAHLEVRPVGAAPGDAVDVPELVAWVRLVAGGPLDAAALVVLTDALPPALYATLREPVPVPTVELAVTLTGAAADPGWVLARIRTRSAGGGWCVDDSEVWSPAGVLLASGRQTRRVLGDLPARTAR